MDTKHVNGAFAPYEENYILSTVHRIVDDNPICGQLFSDGEFLLSAHNNDKVFALICGVDLDVVTCKKCLKIMAKEIK